MKKTGSYIIGHIVWALFYHKNKAFTLPHQFLVDSLESWLGYESLKFKH